MEQSIDCPCGECKKIRELLREKVKSGDVSLVGLEEDKRKILREDGGEL